MQNPPHVLTVDAAGTLIRPWPSVGAVYGETARAFGISVQDEEVDAKFYEIFGKIQKDQKATMGEEKDFWRKVVLEVFQAFSDGRELDPLFEELWELFARGDHWRLAEGASETLAELNSRGYRLAVLSNNDSRLRSVLADLEIDRIFDEIFISSELGVEKPDLEIFRKVERRFNKIPSHFLHLGDSHSRDFLGAKKAGWSALLFGRPVIEQDQITSFKELLEILPR